MLKVKIENREVVIDNKLSLLDNLLNINVKIDYGCRSGSCGKCKCQLVQGKIKEIRDHSYTLSTQEIHNGYILSCQSLAETDLILKLL